MDTIAVAALLLLIGGGAILVFSLIMFRRNRHQPQHVDTTENVAEKNVKLLVAKVLKVETEYSKLQEALREANQKLCVNEEKRKGLEAEVQKHEAERTRFQQESRHLKEGLRDAVEVRKNLEIQIGNLKAECLKLQNDLRMVEKERDQAKDGHRFAQEDQQRYEEALQTAELEIHLLKEQLEKKSKEKDEQKEVSMDVELREPFENKDVKSDSNSRAPEKIGKDLSNHKEPPQKTNKENNFHHTKPEVVCWKRAREWLIGIEMPHEYLEKPNLAVLQDEAPLIQDEFNEGFWPLKKTYGSITIKWNGITEACPISCGNEKYLLFKLSAKDPDWGRLVRYPTSGTYLATVPSTWQRDEAISGHAIFEPEAIVINGYRAHFFNLNHDSRERIAFRTHNEKPFLLKRKKKKPEPIEDVFLAPNVRWAIGEVTAEPTYWTDKLLTLSRCAFKATSDKAMWLRFSKTFNKKGALISFGKSITRKFPVRTKKRIVVIPFREFCDSIEIKDHEQECQIKVWTEQEAIPIAVIKTVWYCNCESCDFVADNRGLMAEHIKTNHLDSFITRLSYSELVKEFALSLPREIYECGYCEYYVPSDDKTQNPTTSICDHIAKDCLAVDRAEGLHRIRFSIVSDVDKIRQHLFHHLPLGHKCICGKVIKDASNDHLIEHLFEYHKFEIIRLK